MNEIKIFFLGFFIDIFLAVVLSILFRLFRHRTDTDVGTRIEQAGTTCKSAKGTIDKIAGTTEQASRIEQDAERTNEQLTTSIKSSKSILAELRKRHPKN